MSDIEDELEAVADSLVNHEAEADAEANAEVENEYLPYAPSNNYYDYSQLKTIHAINKVFERSLTDTAPRAETPREIRIPLKPHQAALLQGMEQLETSLRTGVEAPDKSTLYSRYAILGDAVGAGKSLTVLGHIARMKNKKLPSPAYYHKHSTPYMYSTLPAPQDRNSLKATLILVPHSLYRQWTDYINTQTSLKVEFCKSRRFLTEEKVAVEKITKADAVLVSNTMYEDVQQLATLHNIHWDRIFVDEVDTIQISRNRRQLHADFVWFITATWIPCITAQNTYITSSTVDYYISRGDVNLDNVHADFKANYLAPTLRQRSTYVVDSHWQSMAFFTPFLNRHPNRYMIVLRTTDQFRNSSLALPAINVNVLRCKGMRELKIVHSVLSPHITEMLHAGDISGALIQLGVPESTPMSLVEAVTLNQQKELRRLEATLEFKRGLEYSTAALKEAALAALETKIKSLKEQIATFEKRVEEMDKENCAICYEPLSNTICVPCCKQLFCGGCILELLKRNNSCPMCRAKIAVKDLKSVKKGGAGTAAAKAAPVTLAADALLFKPDSLLRLIQQNPEGRFIIFSRYENPFEGIQAKLEEASITVAQLKGNKDVIYSLIDKFREGHIRVLLLNSEHFATGMNLEAASHVVLYHGNMSPNERQQIIGRAHRLGRKGPLTVVQMLHENETQ